MGHLCQVCLHAYCGARSLPASPMSLCKRVVLLAALAGGLSVTCVVPAQPKTVCTITVNSPDEKEVLRRGLPADEFRFVELVEHGRPDWLASA